MLTRHSVGWILDEGRPAEPAAVLRLTGEAAWRLLTGTDYDSGEVELIGQEALTEPLLQVRGIITNKVIK